MPYRSSHEPASFEVDGTKLRIIRKNRGETLAQFAAQCGISFGFLSQLELGNKPGVAPATFLRICAVLGLDTDERRRTLLTAAARKRAEKVAA